MSAPHLPRRRWSYKPPVGSEIDRDHPLAKGLEFFAAANEGAGSLVDLATGAIGSNVGTWGYDSTSSATTRVLTYNGSSDQSSFGDNPRWRTGGDFTLVFFGNPASAGTVKAGITKHHNAGNFDQISILFNSDMNGVAASGSWALLHRDATNNAQSASVSGLDGKYHQYAASFKASSTAIVQYLDGVSKTTTHTGSGFPAYSQTDPLILGGANGTLFYPASIGYAMWYSRVLSQPEVAALYEDPWQVIRVPGVLPTFSVATGPSPAVFDYLYRRRRAV